MRVKPKNIHFREDGGCRLTLEGTDGKRYYRDYDNKDFGLAHAAGGHPAFYVIRSLALLMIGFWAGVLFAIALADTYRG